VRFVSLMWVWQCIVVKTWKLKGQLDATDWFLYRSTCFGHHYAHHQELKIYTDFCCLWYLALWFAGRWPGMANRTHNTQLHTRTTTCKPERQVPQAANICINLELLMMGIMVPDTCWANNKFCNKESNLLHLLGFLISTYEICQYFLSKNNS